MSVLLAGYTITKPSVGPTLAAGGSSGGLNTGTYSYKVTFVTAFGETDGGTVSSNGTTTTGSMTLTAIAVSTDGNVTSRKLYRTASGNGSAGPWTLLVTIADNITTTYTDITADATISGTATVPVVNTANSRQTLGGTLVSSNPSVFSVENAIAATGASQATAYPLTKEYSIVATQSGGGTSVVLPLITTNTIGLHMLVGNDTGVTINVFPQGTQTITVGGVVGGAGAAVTVATTGRIELISTAATNWNKLR